MAGIRRRRRRRGAAQERKDKQRRSRPTRRDLGDMEGPTASQERRRDQVHDRLCGHLGPVLRSVGGVSGKEAEGPRYAGLGHEA
ncbi:hypothetical protein NDU88_006618 [Pleurodeles waltl]|uniref:Uncharacterized protein n=1 Tax=Pleurodeles waltl TaxID=8319 RepID=A0AAV7WES6_PLEWA|nr:hypothetical protein NDU88_006618 [Pleurodeles waltl]